MSSLQTRIRSILTQSTQRQFAILFGSATSALIATLKLLFPNKNGYVGIPANVCPNVAISVYAAGMTPVYFDINEKTCGISPEDILKSKPKLDVLIAVHSYGIPCAIEKIDEICSRNGIVLIEDAAAAQGTMAEGKPVGSYGDVSIFSFGAGKIVSVGRNGAALTNNPEIADGLERFSKNFGGGDPIVIETISKLHTFFYNSVPPAILKNFSFIFRKFSKENPGIWCSGFDDSYSAELLEKIKNIKGNINRRRDLANMYTKIFSKSKVPFLLLEPGEGGVCWRYNIFLPQKRDYILKSMVSEGYLISSWYPSIVPYFEEENDVLTPNTDLQGNQILNFWVNDQVNKSLVEKTATRVIELYNESQKADLCG